MSQPLLFLTILELILSLIILFFIISGLVFWSKKLVIGDYFLYLVYCPSIIRGWQLVKKFPEYKSTDKHHAIIVTHMKKSLKCATYADGVDILVNYFHTEKIPYKVYHCYEPEEFKEVVNNPHAEYLWIFGHGAKHYVGFKNSKILNYCELRNAPKKKFIAQLHCNHREGKSLADYLTSPEGAFVEGGIRKVNQNRRDVSKLMKRFTNSLSNKNLCTERHLHA